ncbi:MAG: 2-oxoacid:acceptor oxidoreductase family protein [Defluviitaleaceae bacterium]|nr:2-oxoacid:acceptor oxidoreductase family protein [Defluviitaleaceae bacterium]
MTKIVFSGFGGQGVLTLGQLVASLAMKKGKQVTWMPSYGAEMRGGTANCTVIVSDKIIGSPVAYEIDILVAMNTPSIDKFANSLKNGSFVFSNSTLVKEPKLKDDVKLIEIDATGIATKIGNIKVANMVMLAGFLQTINLFTLEDIEDMLQEKFSVKYPHLIPLNMEAIKEGILCIA